MSELESSFDKLLGRQATEAERTDLYRVRDALGLKNNDALWLVLMALQHYKSQYEAFPQRIGQAATESLAHVKAVADATIKASVETAKVDMAKAMATAATEVANSASAKQMWRWASACLAIAFSGVALFGWYMHSNGIDAGFKAGHAQGYSEAKDEKAAAAWANTPEGRAAYQLAQSGSISKLLRCDQPGWYVEKNACYVKQANDGNIYGWRLP